MSSQDYKLYTIDDANKLIPELKIRIIKLRALRDELIRLQDASDIAELTMMDEKGNVSSDSSEKLLSEKQNIHKIQKRIENELGVFDELGCELKGLDPGLVDFYSEKNGEIIFLCWEESEECITHWHSLDTGYAGRQPL